MCYLAIDGSTEFAPITHFQTNRSTCRQYETTETGCNTNVGIRGAGRLNGVFPTGVGLGPMPLEGTDGAGLEGALGAAL
jgi:hypothetical protein